MGLTTFWSSGRSERINREDVFATPKKRAWLKSGRVLEEKLPSGPDDRAYRKDLRAYIAKGTGVLQPRCR